MVKKSFSAYQQKQDELQAWYKNNHWSTGWENIPDRNAFNDARLACEAKDANGDDILTDEQKANIFVWLVYWKTGNYINAFELAKREMNARKEKLKAFDKVAKYAEKNLAPFPEKYFILKNLKKTMNSFRVPAESDIHGLSEMLKPFMSKRGRIITTDTLERSILVMVCDMIRVNKNLSSRAGEYHPGVIRIAAHVWAEILPRRTDSNKYIRDKLFECKNTPTAIIPIGLPLPISD